MISYSIDEAPIYKRYQNEAEELLTGINIKFAHEAGFDSYMTGCALLCAAKHTELDYIRKQKDELKSKAGSQGSNISK